jgi:predicted metal-dependent HD superfamily phosphohydrolase
MYSQLKQAWLNAVAPFTNQGEAEWERISAKYTTSGRHYHTLQHLANMYALLQEYYGENIPVTIVLALFYHDYEYSPLRGDNEAQSANFAVHVLQGWKLDDDSINKIVLLINETKHHHYTGPDNEVKIFLDADMAILGADETTYNTYTANVRREYSVFPDILYNKGRRDFVKKTLGAEHIYMTEFFRSRFEQQARLNLQTELNSLL